MAFNKQLVADSVVQRLIENQGIYSFMNRSFDGLVRAGASSVDVPSLAAVVVKTAGTAPLHADRKKSKTDTTMVNVPLSIKAIPLADEILGQYESNGTLIKEYLNSAAMALQEKFDIDAITEGQSTTDKTAFAGASMAWTDIVAISKKFDVNKVPKTGRVIVVDANLADEFFAIDVIKSAVAYNQQFLSTGTMMNILGMKFFISGLVPTVTIAAAQKYNMVGIYGPGLAFILSRNGEVKEAWDGENLVQVIDMLAHSGQKLFDPKFAVLKYKP